MVIISVADPIFYPVAAVLTMAFVLLIISFIPQADRQIGQKADIQNSKLEIMSMTSTLFHGYSYSADDGTPIRDSQAISYLICGKNPSSDWLDISNQEYIDTGTPQIPSYYEFSVSFDPDPANCAGKTNHWNAPQSQVGGGSLGEEDQFVSILPVRGGGQAYIRVDYGVS